MEFSFFTTDNKSGYKTNERWFSKNHPEVYNKIINYNNNHKLELNFKEKIWFYFNGLTERPKCKTCGKEVAFRNRFDKPYGDFCSLSCINSNKEEMINRQKKTFNEKYGVDFYPNHHEFVKKQQLTKLKKYGKPTYNNVDKMKKTKFEKYGNENFSNIEKYKITCLNKYGTENYATSNSYKNKIKENFKTLYPNINFVEIGKSTVTILCHDCGDKSEITKQLLYERYKRNYVVCSKCNPIGQSFVSGHEEEISKFLQSINIEHDKSKRNLIKGELDLYIERKNLAIEVNGVYWHNELFLPSDYHLKKTISCQDKGINLIHIFEDEWLFKSDIVKSIIKNKLGVTSNKIYARQCVIKEIDAKTSKNFLENNHIQGNVNSKVRLGLFHNNSLVSLMTFSKGRVIMGGKDNEWELTRFCNVLDTSVIGAAGKLFKYFLNQYKPSIVVSYSDIRLHKGGLYEKIGFIRKSQSKPNYWYVINNMRHHRFNFRKSVLIKEGYPQDKSEREIMFDRGIYRIYDCGNIRWEFRNTIY